MKIAVEFPSVSYREGGEGVRKLAAAIESIGYDQLDMFDHVVMGFPTDTRPAPVYPPQMPILEALITLGYVAAATSRIGLGTEVLVLPQRQPTLVAKQVSTLDTLSGGRVRLGVGVGWQQSEYEALGEDFTTRGARMDEAIRLLRTYWDEERVDFRGRYYRVDEIAMEPKPPQGRALPIWIGGGSERALRRTGELGDGWLATGMHDPERARAAIESIHRHAEDAGRDPRVIGLQSMLDVPPRDASGRTFYQDLDRVARRAADLKAMGFGWVTVNVTAIFQAGARSIDAMIDQLGGIHDRLRSEVGRS
jgi:probable F420-dependent oxidoreductase